MTIRWSVHTMRYYCCSLVTNCRRHLGGLEPRGNTKSHHTTELTGRLTGGREGERRGAEVASGDEKWWEERGSGQSLLFIRRFSTCH